mmetsp:Transcript_43280/g.140389  ORF Transcript_43280/g.140389 Transcript_43280/m.140389 type:complete len:218 (-) Transcript_43280:876-1529(-)
MCTCRKRSPPKVTSVDESIANFIGTDGTWRPSIGVGSPEESTIATAPSGACSGRRTATVSGLGEYSAPKRRLWWWSMKDWRSLDRTSLPMAAINWSRTICSMYPMPSLYASAVCLMLPRPSIRRLSAASFCGSRSVLCSCSRCQLSSCAASSGRSSGAWHRDPSQTRLWYACSCCGEAMPRVSEPLLEEARDASKKGRTGTKWPSDKNWSAKWPSLS